MVSVYKLWLFILMVASQNTFFPSYLGQLFLPTPFSGLFNSLVIQLDSFVRVCISSFPTYPGWFYCGWYMAEFILCGVQFYMFWQIHEVIYPPPQSNSKEFHHPQQPLMLPPLPLVPPCLLETSLLFSILIVLPFLNYINEAIQCVVFWTSFFHLTKCI